MAINVGSQPIIKNGLVVCLDAASLDNYSPLTSVEVLVVGGGGGGGFGETNVNGGGAGGGGAGGLLYSSNYSITPGSNITVTVGNGGSSAGNETTISNNGQNSVFGSLVAIGGGGGGGGGVEGTSTANSGGSGGGAGGDGSTVAFGGAGTSGQGFAGGGRISSRNRSGSGGGGAGAIGTPGAASGSYGLGGKGGNGLLFNISGYPRYYAGGGGGANSQNFGAASTFSGGAGGTGGGGRGGPFPRGVTNGTAGGESGVANTGGGGGGGYGTSGGTGGSGVVIVRYPGPQKATGGTITNVGGHTIHTFTGSDTFTPLTEVQLKSSPYGLIDLSGNGYNGIKYGSRVVYNTTETAWEFTDTSVTTSDGIYITDLKYVTESSDGIPNLTIESWIKCNSGTTSHTNDQRIILSFDRSSVFRFAIGSDSISGAAGKPSLMFTTSSGVIDDYASTYSGNLRDDQWHHVVVSFSTSFVKYYVDGNLVHTTNGSYNSIGNQTTSESPRYGWIGNGSEATTAGGTIGPGDLFYGFISKVSMYYKTLNDQEIQQNFNALRGRFGI